MESAKEKRLEAIRSLVRKRGRPTPKPQGMHQAKHPTERPRRCKNSYMLDKKERWTYLPPRCGGFQFIEIRDCPYFKDYEVLEKELGERYARKEPAALTKIAFAKTHKVERVPPWQKKSQRK